MSVFIEKEIELVETILGPYRGAMGENYMGYRNHVYRMLHFCFALHPVTEEEKKKLIIAACFHDLGLFTHNTVDYLPPSVELAKQYLQTNKLDAWAEEISLMIDMHHKITAYENPKYPLVEVFRVADLADFSLGLLKGELSGEFVNEVKENFSNAGFHMNLLKVGTRWVLAHPFNPAPIIKW